MLETAVDAEVSDGAQAIPCLPCWELLQCLSSVGVVSSGRGLGVLAGIRFIQQRHDPRESIFGLASQNGFDHYALSIARRLKQS